MLDMLTPVAVWLDHREARVFQITTDAANAQTVRLAQHIHHKNPPKHGSREHPDDAKKFFSELCHALDGSGEILVLGPSTAKLAFIRYVHKSQHTLEPRIAGVESVDHPTDGQLVAYARQYFGLTTRL
jgi:stalled ribosome rescue protein Dom34